MVPVDDPAFKESERAVNEQVHRMLAVNGNRTVDDIHRQHRLLIGRDVFAALEVTRAAIRRRVSGNGMSGDSFRMTGEFVPDLQ